MGRDYARRADGVRVDFRGLILVAGAVSADDSLAAGNAGLTLYGFADQPMGKIELTLGTTTGFQWKLFDDVAFSNWTAYGGAALVIGLAADRFSFLRWNATILAMNPDASTALQVLTPAAHTYVAVAGAPAAFHIAGFTNRVVASRVTGNLGRIQWSVKNDSTDWAGLGSGFEDLLAATGSRADIPWSVWPISETQAIVVCEHSLMMMTATDNFDAPFRFSVIAGAEGTPHPYSVAAVPGGIIYAGWNDIWYVTEENQISLGKPFLSEILFGREFGITDHLSILGESHSGVFVPATGEYWLKTVSTLYRYQLSSKTWTTQTISQGQMTYVEGLKLLNAGGTEHDWAVYHINVGVLVNRSLGSAAADVIDLITGDIEPDLPEYKLDVVYVSLSYLTRDTVSRQVDIQVSIDDGDWESYGTFMTKPYVAAAVTSSPSNRTHIITVHRSLTGDKMAFRIKNTVGISGLKILRLSVHCNKAGWTPTTR